MTTITLINDLGRKVVKVNGRKVYDTVTIARIEKVSGGVWWGKTAWGDTFRVIGGWASGGGRNEWFLEYPLGFGDQAVCASSAVECFRMMGRV